MNGDPGHIIAVDGGGSTCRVAVATDAGRILAVETGPAANVSTALPAAMAAIADTLRRAWAQAGLAPDDMAAATAYLGLAGVKNPRIAAEVARAVPAAHVTVAEDRAPTMAGALGDQDGFLAAIGTGSFLGRQTGGDQRFVGGYGLILGDQASGAWLGRRLLARVLEWQDGLREGSDLLARTLAEFANDPSAIIAFAADARPHQFAERAPVLLDAADAGDQAARQILLGGAAYLQHGLDSLGFRRGDPLCLIGGIGPRFAAWLDPHYTAKITAPLGTALDGAVRLAIAAHAARKDSR